MPAFYNAKSYNVLPNGSDMTSAMQSMLNTISAGGGGTIEFEPGTYRFDGQIVLPYTGGPSNPIAAPIILEGSGEWRSGTTVASPAQGGTIFDCRYNGSDSCFLSLHQGQASYRHITFSQRQTTPHTTPYIKTTNTVLQISECSFEGHSTITAATADQDCIILGGTSTSYPSDDPDNAFQGYGTVIERCNFNRIQRGVYGRVFANAVKVCNNSFWAQCGGVSAIEFDSGNGIDYCVGGLISGNLIECVGYTTAIKITRGSRITLIANDFYDNSTAIDPAYVVLTNCLGMIVIAGVGNDALKPYLNDSSQCAIYQSTDDLYPSRFRSIKSGISGYPNQFGATTFTGGSGETVIQPASAVAIGADLLSIKRSAAEASDPSAQILAVRNDGAIIINASGAASQNNAGNITNSLASAASWTGNGKNWIANGVGGNMIQNSGTGGSYFQMRNFGLQWRLHSDNSLQAQISPSFGGSGLAGIGFGASLDVSLYRISAGVWGQTGVKRTPSFTVATLPAAATAGAGATAFVTDANAPTFQATVTGGGATLTPVYSDGANWKVG